mgnify:CR=1 FL=1
MNIALHETTKMQLRALSAQKPQALLLFGQEGSGLKTLALETAKEWGKLLEVVEPVAKTKSSLPAISVEIVRTLYERTRMKLDADHTVVIDDADLMSDAAQNAFLKLLEEPAGYIHFILTSHRPESLLATIRSRVQSIHVQPLDDATSSRLLRTLGVTDEKVKAQLLFIAKGLPAELSRLASNKDYLEQKGETVRLARDFVRASTYQKLIIAQKVASSRQNALIFIDDVMLLLKKTVDVSADERSLQLLDKLIEAKEHIAANANVRLQLASVVI